jgi:Flp pilus assembly protein TadD
MPDAALPFLREAQLRAPKAPALPLLEGWILLGQGRAAEAAGRFRKARELDPLSWEAANGEGLAAWHEGKLEEAKSLFRAATGISSPDPEPRNNLASVLLAEGREAEALPWLDEVLSAHPRFVPARINRGVALARLGRLEEAMKDYREALRLDPGNPDATYNLERAKERGREKLPGGAVAPGAGTRDSSSRR